MENGHFMSGFRAGMHEGYDGVPGMSLNVGTFQSAANMHGIELYFL